MAVPDAQRDGAPGRLVRCPRSQGVPLPHRHGDLLGYRGIDLLLRHRDMVCQPAGP